MQAFKRNPSKRKDNFQVKLEEKGRFGIPRRDSKSHDGSVKPITHYKSSYQNFGLHDNLKKVS